MFFENWESLGRVAIVAVCAYVGLILVLRVGGKRSLAKLNAFDFVVTIALGSTLATVLLSKDVGVSEGLAAFTMLAVLQYLITAASVRWHWFKRLVRSEPQLLVSNGRFLEEAMRDERVTRSELDAAIRKQGIGRVEDVAALVLETDGSFSVIEADAGPAELSALESVEGPHR